MQKLQIDSTGSLAKTLLDIFNTKDWTNLGAKLRIILTDKDEWDLLQKVFTATVDCQIKDDPAGKKMRQYKTAVKKVAGKRGKRAQELEIPPKPDIAISQVEKTLYCKIEKRQRMKLLQQLAEGNASWKSVYQQCTAAKKMAKGLRWVAAALGFETFEEVPSHDLC